jgi:hypothetical protein
MAAATLPPAIAPATPPAAVGAAAGWWEQLWQQGYYGPFPCLFFPFFFPSFVKVIFTMHIQYFNKKKPGVSKVLLSYFKIDFSVLTGFL